MSNAHDAGQATWLDFPYDTCKNISCPDDKAANRKIYAGKAPATSFLQLTDDENVRRYLVDAEGKKRQTPSQVHRQIRDTLDNRPEQFPVLNSGLVIVARNVTIDDTNRKAKLLGPSIINGSQTHGELRAYIERMRAKGDEPYAVHVSFELVETTDPDLVAEISIARNFQNDVASISIVGRRKQLDELEARLQAEDPTRKLRKKETDRADDYTDTEKLLQVITALIPAELWPKKSESENPLKVYTYSIKSKCLREFETMYKLAKDTKPEDLEEKNDIPMPLDRAKAAIAGARDLYAFYLDIASEALALYEKWKAHPAFKGSGLHSITRDAKGNVVDVPDGIVFPILAALSAFAIKRDGRWRIEPPPAFQDEELYKAAKRAYIDMAFSNPWNMGKSKACYTHLYQITSIYKQLMPSV